MLDPRAARRLGVTVVETDRGGDVTYHGPGQLVGYPILFLPEGRRDLHRYLRDLEDVLIDTLAAYGVRGGRVSGKTGVWVGGAKIAAIGVRVTRWVTSHGFALNVTTDLDRFRWIVPCGIEGCRVTSLEALTGRRVPLPEVAEVAARALAARFGLALETFDAREAHDAIDALVPPAAIDVREAHAALDALAAHVAPAAPAARELEAPCPTS